jgi:hydrogenase maturation protein HypF
MWQQLLDDLVSGTDSAAISTRFHRGLANALSNLAIELCQAHNCQTIALSGGVYQNKVLFKLTQQALQKKNLKVLSHHQVPANDGGLSLGQALIAAARQPTRR